MSAELRRRFLSELHGSIAVLDGAETAAIAEAWASSAVAEWLALGGRPGQLVDELSDRPLASATVSWIEGSEPPMGDGLLSDVGRHRAVEAWEMIDPSEPDERGVIITYEAPSGDLHDVSVSIIAGSLASLTIGPSGLADAVESESDRFVRSPLDSQDALRDVSRVLRHVGSGLTPMSEASIPLLQRRLGTDAITLEPASADVIEIEPRDSELDRYAADVVRSALRKTLESPPPAEVLEEVRKCQLRVEEGDPDALALIEVAGLTESTVLDVNGLVHLVGAYLAPSTLHPHAAAEQEALAYVEPADWIGVVLGLSRASVGTSVDGDMLVTAINRAPEITTSVPKRDAPLLAWTFELMLYAWEVTGVLHEGTVGPAASWLLPHGAIAAWESPR